MIRDNWRYGTVQESGGRRSGKTKVTMTDSPGDQSLLRENNLSLVSRTIFSASQPISRVSIAETTGLTRATVSRLVEELIEARLVEKLEPIPASQQGRPAHLLIPQPRSVAGIGLEVNVDLIAGRALDLQGNTLSEFHVKGDYRGADPIKVLTQLSHLASATVEGLRLGNTHVAGVTLAVPGVIDHSTGNLLSAPNLGWNNIPLRQIVTETLTEKLNTPLEVWNDADQQALCAAYDAPGRLRESSTFIYLAGDLGIGGALVYGGTVDTGLHGSAGEIGHMCVDINGPECFCGSHGCLERYAGMSAILAGAGLDPSSNRTDDLIPLLEANIPAAFKAVNSASSALSVAIANAVNLLDIPLIILGTDLGRLLPWLEPNLTSKAKKMIIGRSSQDLTIIQGNSTPTPACTGGAFAALLRPINHPSQWIDLHK